MCIKRILVLGGDMRIVSLANCFNQEGYDVMAFGFLENIEFDGGIERHKSLKEALSSCDMVIMGLPVTGDDETISTPLYDEKIYIEDVLKFMKKEQLLMGGKISGKVKNLCKMYNISAVDYFEREELTVLNAIPTAEGAIEIAMRELPITIHGSNSLVLGFGRIGKILSKNLNALGAKTYVEARRFDDLSWIKAYGYEGIYLKHLKEKLPLFDVIFNTVPHQIITGDMMKYIKKDCIIIDLASLPGGVDIKKAEAMGIKVISALSLPGKAAPKTSGEIIKHTIQNMLSDMGV